MVEDVWPEAVEEIYLPGNESMDVRDWFGFAWNRKIPSLLSPPPGRHLNLGAGYRQIQQAESVDLENGFDLDDPECWNIEAGSVSCIWAHGVMEHVKDPILVLRQCERVLEPGGLMNIVVPHGASYLQLEDITHKHAFTEETWKNLFNNEYYNVNGGWQLKVHTCFIMGVVWRNLALFTQLVKE